MEPHLSLGVSFRNRSRSGEEILNSAKERAESPRRQQSGIQVVLSDLKWPGSPIAGGIEKAAS